MSTNDLMSEAVEAVGGWQAYIARKRRELEGQIAEMHDEPVPHDPTPTTVSPMPPSAASVMRTFPQAPLPTPEDSAVEVAAEPPNNNSTDTLLGREEVATPNTTEADYDGEAQPADDEGLTPAPEAGGTEGVGVFAQFETAWRAAPPERLPQMVQNAYAQREEQPDIFAQRMVGASANGYLTPALEQAIEELERVDTHFQAAHLLFQDPQFAGLFEIAMDARDYGDDDTSAEAESDYTDDISAEGEADRAAANGEEPF